MKDELREVKKKYATERRTLINDDYGIKIDSESLLPKGCCCCCD